ncbi:ribosome-associated translation inhibitor RaiA [uncultured Dokdonia sp.]|uniref:ribosome hibernation-promoting factor, HPF/YfiA family n=1 Tax=uncultured Dokdonia sp. TaxID=575653 RepID=UPI00261F1F4E|nr:ribosome-associated translation inhibitor RaiA [uncultured Dokdonia sp.]
MDVQIAYVKIDSSEALTTYIEDKLVKLFKRYDWLIKANVFIKKETGQTHHNAICEIELSVPGPTIFAQSQEKNFEMAVKETISDLDVQLKKRKAQFTNQKISS